MGERTMKRTLHALAPWVALLAAACGGKGTSPQAAMPTGDGTGAVSAVEADEAMHYENMAEMIRGQVPGLEVIDGSGGDFQLRVRGAAPAPTLSGGQTSDGAALTLEPVNRDTEPLVVIDGMPVGTGNNARALKALHPSNVESITVYKDVSSTSVYGLRGAHGVVVIRTKR